MMIEITSERLLSDVRHSNCVFYWRWSNSRTNLRMPVTLAYDDWFRDSLLLPAAYHFIVEGGENMPKHGLIGIDIGGTKLLVTLFDSGFEPIDEIKVKTPRKDKPA